MSAVVAVRSCLSIGVVRGTPDVGPSIRRHR